jgi:prepilin-type N-terminal cleavage/methylation domain-containing protein
MLVHDAKHPWKRTNGLTLVEVMIAMTIFAIFITGAVALIMQSRKASDVARDSYTAINIAKNQLELLRTLKFNELPSYDNNSDIVDWTGASDLNGPFRRIIQVIPTTTNLCEVIITVQMRDRFSLAFGTAGQAVIQSYVADYYDPFAVED